MENLLFTLEENDLIKKVLGNIDISSIKPEDVQIILAKLKDFKPEGDEELTLASIIQKVSLLLEGTELGDNVEGLLKDFAKDKGADLLGKFFK